MRVTQNPKWGGNYLMLPSRLIVVSWSDHFRSSFLDTRVFGQFERKFSINTSSIPEQYHYKPIARPVVVPLKYFNGTTTGLAIGL